MRPPLDNESGLPDILVRAVQNDTYNKGEKADFSVTGLIQPPRIAQLRREHRDDIREDVADRIYALMGTAIHVIMERAASDRYIVKKRYTMEFEGAVISGEPDLYDRDTKENWDWKITSRWTAADGAKEEWIQQQNLYRYLLWKNGIEVSACKNGLIFRDWSKMMAARQKDYPQRQVEVVNIPLWSRPQVEAYLSERIAMHRAAKLTGESQVCTEKERWARPAKFAVMQKGRKKALKLYDSLDQADGAKKEGQFVAARPGSNVRCVHYCPVMRFCREGREWVQEECQKD